jgi:hypothetical protein
MTDIADPVEAGPGTLAFVGYSGRWPCPTPMAGCCGRHHGRTAVTTPSPTLCPQPQAARWSSPSSATRTPPDTGLDVRYLAGFDLTTRTQRWKVTVDGLRTRLRETERKLRPVVAAVGDHAAVAFGKGSVLLNGRSGQIAGHTPLTDWSGGGSQDTLRLGHCPAKKVTAVCAYDTSTGRTVWTAVPPSESFLLDGIGTYGGRAYVLLSPSSDPTRLGVIDQRTGTWQAQPPLLGIVTPHQDEPYLYKITGTGVVIGPPGGTGPSAVLANKDT